MSTWWFQNNPKRHEPLTWCLLKVSQGSLNPKGWEWHCPHGAGENHLPVWVVGWNGTKLGDCIRFTGMQDGMLWESEMLKVKDSNNPFAKPEDVLLRFAAANWRAGREILGVWWQNFWTAEEQLRCRGDVHSPLETDQDKWTFLFFVSRSCSLSQVREKAGNKQILQNGIMVFIMMMPSLSIRLRYKSPGPLRRYSVSFHANRPQRIY